MESTDSDGEDGCAALRQNQMDRRVREENFYEFVSNLSEDDYELMRDHDLLGIPGESTLEELLERFQEIKENSPAYSEENTGGEESSTTSGEDPLDFLNPFGQTEDATSGQRENQTWEETRHINSDSNDSTFRLPVNSKPNNGSPNPENEYVASTRYPRAYKMKNSQSPAEKIQSESKFIGSPGSEQITTEALLHGPVTTGQRRARSRSPADQGTRARTDSPAPNRTNERLQRFHSRLRYPTFEPLVKETENFPSIPHQETSRQPITGLELPNRGLAAASGTRGALEEESSPDTTNDGESWRRGPSNPTKPPNPEVGQVCPRAYSERDSRAIVPDLRIEIPNDTVTLESEQGGLGQEGRAENIQSESTFIGSPASERSTTEALIHGPVTTGQRRPRSRSPDDRGTRISTERPAPNIIHELLERFHYTLRNQILESMGNETENFPRVPHQETSRQQITGLELQTRGLAAASGTSGALAEESSPETPSDGESWSLGLRNPTTPPNPDVGQVCPRAHCQRDSIARRFQLTCQIPNDTVTLESEEGGLGHTFPHSEQTHVRACNSENNQSPAKNIESESTFIGSPGSEQSTTVALLHGPVTRSQRRARSRSPADRGIRARTESPAPNRTNERLQRFHSRLRYPTFEPLVKETENFPRIPHQETSRQQTTGLERQNRGLASHSGTRGALDEESSPETTSDGESWRRGPSNPTIPPNPEVGQVCPRAHSQRHSIAPRIQLTCEIPNNTVTLESDQSGLGHESRAENIQSESKFIGSLGSEQRTTKALLHGPVTRGQRRARSRSPADRGTRARTESPAPNRTNQRLQRFHSRIRYPTFEPLVKETENFPRFPHQETSRQEITGLELQNRGLVSDSGTNSALEESSPESTSDGESWRPGQMNPTIPPNREVGQVCPRVHSQRDSIVPRFDLRIEIPNDTVTLEREQGGLGQESRAENLQTESTFIKSPGSEQKTTKALLHGPVTRGQRRARSRSPADRGTRARTESPAPNRTNQRLQRFHSRIRYPTFEPLVKETENFPRFPHQETSRQEITGLELQNRGLVSHSGTNSALEESSPESTSDGESWRPGQMNPTIPPNREVGQVCPRVHSQRDSIVPRFDLRIEIPNDTVTLEREQGGLGQESRAENLQTESTFIKSPGSEQKTTKALLHGPVTRGQRRARSRSPADRGTRARTESPAPNRTNQRLQRFHSRIRYPTFEPLVKETENFPRFPHQETSRQEITGLELQNRGLVSDSGTNSALEESSPESTSDGESWRPGQMNPTIPPNREVGQVCPRVHSQRDSIVPRFDLRIEIPNDTVTLEREQGGLGQESRAENLQTESTFIKSPGSEQKTTKALLHGPVTRGQRRPRSRSPADRGTRARTESPAPNRTNQRLQRFHSRIRYPTFEPLVKETENFPRFPHQETSRQEITGLELQNRGLVSHSGTNSALEESSPESTSDGESWRPGQMNPTIPPNREVGQVCPRVHSQRDSIVPRFDLRIEIPNDTVTLEREQGGLGQESRAENLQTDSTFIKSPGSEQRTTKALLHGPVTRGQQRARSRSPADRGTRARTESPAPNRNNERFQRFHSRLRYPTSEPLVKETENFPRIPHQDTSRQQTTGLELQNRGLAAASGTSGAPAEESSPETTSDGESWRRGQSNPTKPPNPEVGQVCSRAQSQTHSIAKRCQLTFRIPNDTVTAGTEEGGLGDTFPHCEQPDARAYNSENSQSPTENIEPKSTFIGSPGSDQSTTEALLHGPVTTAQRRARSRSPDHPRTRARTESPDPNKTNERLQRFQTRLRYPTFEPLAKENESFPTFLHQETSRQQITGLELPNRGLAAASGTSGAPAEERSPETTSDGESWRRGQSNPTIPPNPEVGQVCPRAQSQTHSIANRCQLTCEIPNDAVTVESEQGALGDTFPRSEQPGARAYNSENSQSPAENIESESTFIGSPGSEQSPAWNAGIPSLHILWSTGFDDIPSPPIQSPLRHTVTGSSDLSDSDLSDSDTDLVHSVSSLSSDMESEGSISETDASDATTPSVLNSYPSCDSSSPSTSISSSGSNYIIISSSSPIPSSSSSAEDSEGNSVIFVGSSNTRSSPGSLSETRHENRSLSPITFDYGDSWDQFYPVIYDSDDQWAGLPTVQIDNLPIRSYAEGDALQSCAICITEYTEGNRVRILPCTHQFHVDCVDRWLSENSTCPICRTEVAYSAQRQNSD